MRFTGTNTFTGGWVIENQAQRFGVEFGATGSAGAGDVTVEGNADGTGQGAVIIVNARNSFDPSATLTLNSNGYDNSTGGFGPFTRFLGTEIRIEMLNDATVGALKTSSSIMSRSRMVTTPAPAGPIYNSDPDIRAVGGFFLMDLQQRLGQRS